MSEPPEGFSSATPGNGTAPPSSAEADASSTARSQLTGGPGVVRRCEDCGRDTYSEDERVCSPCREDREAAESEAFDADDVDGVRW